MFYFFIRYSPWNGLSPVDITMEEPDIFFYDFLFCADEAFERLFYKSILFQRERITRNYNIIERLK